MERDREKDSCNVCRTCKGASAPFQDLWEKFEGTVVVANMLMLCASVQVLKDDGLPHSICIDCFQQLINAFNFKTLCEKTDEELRNLKVDSPSSTSGSKIEISDDESNSLLIPKPPVKLDNGNEPVDLDNDDYDPAELDDDDDNLSLIFDPIQDENVIIATSKAEADSDHTCPQCLRVFETQEDCDLHLATHIENIDIFTCALCSEEFAEKTVYDRHMRKLHGLQGTYPKVYICKICNKRQTRLEHAKRHMTVHLKVKPFKCRVCGRGFNNVENMFSHQKRCKGDLTFICEICNRGFNRPDGLQAHMSSHETDVLPMLESLDDIEQYILVETLESNKISEIEEDMPVAVELAEIEQDYLKDNRGSGRPKKNQKSPKEVFIYDKETKLYSCRYCTQKFKRVSHLKRHLFRHNEYKPYTCEICAKQFKRDDHLLRHQKSHYSEKPFQCELCPKVFWRNDQLKDHMERRHPGGCDSKLLNEKKFACSLCEKRFTTEKYRDTHEKAHSIRKKRKELKCKACLTEFETEEEVVQHQKDNIECVKKYLCAECGQRFSKKNYLVVHLRRHRGEKPYQCKFCDKRFTRSTDVGRHEKFHTGEKNHLCIICGKGFGRAYNLTLHMRTHTGEKPYACTYCNAAFAQSNDLKSHIRRHTGERYHCDLCSEAFLMGYLLKQHKRTVHGINIESDRIKPTVKVEFIATNIPIPVSDDYISEFQEGKFMPAEMQNDNFILGS